MSPRPLRVIHVAGTPNGAAWMVAFLREQKSLGHDVAALIAPGDGTIAPALARDGIPVHTIDLNILNAGSPFAAFRKVWRVAQLLRRLRPDVVQSHLFPTLITTRIAAWIADVPVRISTNCGPYHLQTPILRDLETGLAFMDSKTIASCELTQKLMIEHGVPEAQTRLVYYTVDHNEWDPIRADGARFRRAFGIAPDAPVIGQVAHFYEVATNPHLSPPGLVGRGAKGHEFILRALPKLLREFPSAKVVFVGAGWGPKGEEHERAMKQLTRDLGLDAHVIFTGLRHDVPDALASFDIALQCSLNENIGGSAEALLMARPTIVTNVGGLTDTVLHEKTGLVVPPADSDALAAAILRLLRDRDLATRFGNNGRAWMLERFTLARSVADLEQIYRDETNKKPRGYRVTTTLSRIAQLPFRVLPLARRVTKRLAAAANHQPPTANRIAQITAASSGSPWFVAICTELAKRGHDVLAIIDSTPGDLEERLQREGIRVRKVRMVMADHLDRARLPFYAAQLPISALRLARILRREHVAIAHSHIFVANVITRLARILAPVRHIASIVGPRHLEARTTRIVDKLTWSLDDLTVGGCRLTVDLYKQLGVRDDKLACVYYGADATTFDPARADRTALRRELGIDDATPLVGIVAHFYPPTTGPQTPPATRGVGLKGHEHFLAAARIVARRFPNARFVLSGTGSNALGETYRQSLLAQCNSDELLRDRTTFLGHRTDIPNVLAALDVAVQCSLTENLGGTIEALLMARPVVATNVGGMPESVRHEETGLLVPPANAEALASAIIRLLDDRDEAQRFAANGRALMLERFTLTRTVDDLIALYDRLATRGAADSQPVEGRA